MKVINIHTRIITQPIAKVAELFSTLSSENDMMLATDKWSPMILDNGLNIGSKGGHGGMKYHVIDYQLDNYVTFKFDIKGFDGFHKFQISEIGANATELKHNIEMNTNGAGILKWALAIRWLHDAYIEDAFDKVGNHFTKDKKTREWTLWVKILRKYFKPKKK